MVFPVDEGAVGLRFGSPGNWEGMVKGVLSFYGWVATMGRRDSFLYVSFLWVYASWL